MTFAKTARLFLSLLVLLLLPGTRRLAAQAHTNCVGGCGGGGSFTITPDGGSASAPANSTGQVVTFSAHNGTTSVKTVNFSCPTTGPVTCTGLNWPSYSFDIGETVNITATYSTGSAGTGTLTLVGSGGASEQGDYTITVTGSPPPPPPPSAPVVALRKDNDDNLDRGMCLTSGAGEAAAWQCGDLLVTHGTTGFATLNKNRSLTLVYSSAYAAPRRVAVAAVTQSGPNPPTTVYAELKVNSVVVASATYGGWSSGTRQIALAWDASAALSGWYPYTLEIKNQNAGGSASAVVSGHFLLFNDTGWYPGFGRGWTLAGLERIIGLSDNTIVWFGGDGSTERYAVAPGYTWGRWVAPAGAYRDTLLWDGVNYIRLLQHGVQVKYDVNGEPVETISRTGQHTRFYWNTTTTWHLDSIQVPPAGAPGTTYRLVYAGNYLDYIQDPAGRITDVNIVGGKLTSILDPGATVATQFGYAAANRMTSRTNRRGFATTYWYDNGLHVDRVIVPGTLAAGDTTRFQPWDEKGIATGATGQVAVDTALAYTTILGPRVNVADDASFWVNRWGAPTRVTNALGYTTLIARGDTNVPALVTRVQAPNGRVQSATYDVRGNSLTETDSSTVIAGVYATTRYEWDSKWDFVTKIVPPEKDSAMMAYDPSTGNRLWQQDARGSTSRVEFRYYASGVATGLLKATDGPLTPPDSVVYDGGRANLYQVRSPIGFVSTFYRDAVGRDTLVVTPMDSLQTLFRRDRKVYDPLNRVILSQSIGPQFTVHRPDILDRPGYPGYDLVFSAETLTVQNHYSPATGDLDSISRYGRPDPRGVGTTVTRWRRDRVGRVVAEIAPDGAIDSTFNGAGGQMDSTRSRRGYRIRMTYDELGRLQRRITPSASFTLSPETLPNMTWYFPRYLPDATGALATLNQAAGQAFTIPADTALFTYDPMDELLSANNSAAQVTRTWNLNGTMATETQAIRAYGSNSFTQHVYQLRLGYDLNGRRRYLKVPSAVAPQTGSDSMAYAYKPWGRLASVRNVLGQDYAYEYDLEDRTTSAPGELRFFDNEGRLIRRVDASHSDSMWYDARGMLTRVRTLEDSVLNVYSGLGALAWSRSLHYVDQSVPEERYVVDPMGHQTDVFRRTNGPALIQTPRQTEYVYQPSTGRLTSQQVHDSGSTGTSGDGAELAVRNYDASGNLILLSRSTQTTFNDEPSAVKETSWSLYDAGDQLRLADRRTCMTSALDNNCYISHGTDFNDRQAFEEYRYDALGRRVLLRTRGEWGCGGTCRQLAQRFIWDGNQLLAEISAPGGNTAGGAMEDDNPSGPTQGVVNGLPVESPAYLTGRILYTHGAELDRPIMVIRNGYSTLFPGPEPMGLTMNWRGVYDGGNERCESQMGIGGNGGQIDADSLYTFCMEYQYPAAYQWLSYLARQRNVGPRSWMGSLVEGSRDLSGQMYRRNRYYDPVAGQFTQEDPIGLAGGVNLYAYAGSNPVGFTDPFGLSPDTIEVGWHEVLKSGEYHVSIRITPDDQAKWSKDPRFKRGADGRVSLTLGADSKACLPQGMCLISDVNRPTDVAAQKGSQVLDLGGKDENAVIAQLLRADARYGDNLPYNPGPSVSGSG